MLFELFLVLYFYSNYLKQLSISSLILCINNFSLAGHIHGLPSFRLKGRLIL